MHVHRLPRAVAAFRRLRPSLASLAIACSLAACGGGGGEIGEAPASAPVTAPAPGTPPAAGANAAPTIGGTPPVEVTLGRAFAFTPTAADANGDTLTFAIANKPSWATFDAATGALQGTPGAGDVGRYADVGISVSDGKASAQLPPFTIVVNAVSQGTAVLSWEAPTANVDGTPLTDLAGYRVAYGTQADALTQSVKLSNPGLTRFVVENLSAGTWHFAVAAFNAAGAESDLSGVVTQTIR